MDKLISIIKKNKKRTAVICSIILFFIILFVAAYKIYVFLSPSTGVSVYGDRCDLVKGYEITEARENEIKTLISSYENMEVTEIKVACRLIDITVNLKEDVEWSKVEEMSKAILTTLSQDEVNLYDIQLFITSSNKENAEYPKIGTHHKLIDGAANDYFVW